MNPRDIDIECLTWPTTPLDLPFSRSFVNRDFLFLSTSSYHFPERFAPIIARSSNCKHDNRNETTRTLDEPIVLHRFCRNMKHNRRLQLQGEYREILTNFEWAPCQWALRITIYLVLWLFWCTRRYEIIMTFVDERVVYIIEQMVYTGWVKTVIFFLMKHQNVRRNWFY